MSNDATFVTIQHLAGLSEIATWCIDMCISAKVMDYHMQTTSSKQPCHLISTWCVPDSDYRLLFSLKWNI